MTTENFTQNDNTYKPAKDNTQLKTMSIDSRYKELYYQSPQQAEQESLEALKHKQVFWNYMMNVSMQNAIAQMTRKTICP